MEVSRMAGKGKYCLGNRLCIVYALVALSAAFAARAEILIDGELNEPEWKSGVQCKDWRRTEPFALDAPRYRNTVRVVSSPSGLAIGFDVDQPPEARRVKPRTPRDADRLGGDYVQVMLDFDATGEVGYEFTVALGGGVRDAVITNQTEFNLDWDGVWQSAVRETDERWSVELLIPWSTIDMRATTADKRAIGIYATRYLFDRNERFACPGIARDRGVFLADFQRIEVNQYPPAGALDVVPYATALSDLVHDRNTLKAGADIIWKSGNNFRLAAALNPDFGQIESDELVVDFSGIETVFSDKRPFFSENQGLFDLRTPGNGQLIYTRRVGAARDDGRTNSSDIDAAIKLTGNAGDVSYGVFAAQEDHYEQDIGRLFAATRVSLPLSKARIGYLGTWTDRPLLSRTANLHAVDYELTPGDSWRVAGQVLRSDIDAAGTREEGYSAWLQSDLNYTGALSHTAKLLFIDERFDMNDLGYMERNSLRRAEWTTSRQLANLGEHASRSGELQQMSLIYQENADGQRLLTYAEVLRDVRYRNSWLAYQRLRYFPSRIDDVLSRGNGPVHIDPRLSFYADATSPRIGNWRYVFGFNLFQQGVDGYSQTLELNATWYATERLTVRMIALPQHASDWLLWEGGNSFGSYRTRRLDLDLRMDWILSSRHELRLRWQWIGIDAEPVAAYRAAADGGLRASDDPMQPFILSNLGLQIRYRFAIGPQSDLYLVYSRGGFRQEFGTQERVDELFENMWGLRDADQFVLKLRYKL